MDLATIVGIGIRIICILYTAFDGVDIGGLISGVHLL
jgi:hypothetical protein